jgi:hypothetical protein
MEAWAIARMDLGLAEDEWLGMTPRQVQALQEARLTGLQREEWLFGMVATEVANGSFYRRDKPVRPETFMLHPYVDLQTSAKSPIEKLVDQLATLNNAVRVDKIP